LLTAAEAAGFDVFVTTDKNMRYQQNLSARSIAIVVAALDDVDRRKHPLVHQLAVEVYFHVTRAQAIATLELARSMTEAHAALAR